MNRLTKFNAGVSSPFTPAAPSPSAPVAGPATSIGAPAVSRVATCAVPSESGPTGEAGAPSLSTLITADASKMSGADFFEAVFPGSRERREQRREMDRQACIRAIRRGDTYGFPPALIAECEAIMADLKSEVQL